MWWQHWKRSVSVLLAFTLLSSLSAYVGTYVSLRNRGLNELRQYNSEGFLYDSAHRVLQTHDMRTHEFRSRIFAPVNFVDRMIFNGPEPIRCLLFDLS